MLWVLMRLAVRLMYIRLALEDAVGRRVCGAFARVGRSARAFGSDCGSCGESRERLAHQMHFALDVAHEAPDARRVLQYLNAFSVRIVARGERTRDRVGERSANRIGREKLRCTT